MWRNLRRAMTVLAAVWLLAVPLVLAQDSDNYDQNDSESRSYSSSDNYTRIDRYLDAEIWTNHNDNDFYEGDNIVLNYRVNRDAFVAIYSIDSRGNVTLLFPSDPNQDNFVRGGETYRLPSGDDNYDLQVSGPAGTESIQMVASRERFPLPNWYNHSGLVADLSNRDDYMDWLNGTYFVKYSGQQFSYDRLALAVREWEPDYFRPVYAPVYPSWAVCGNMYIDYPWGSTVYINGVYWGCTPLYVPWILCGWHTLTVYDSWGHCWENNIHVSRYNTLVLNRTVIHPTVGVVSKYKEVRAVGYRDPARNGYPNYAKVVAKDRSAFGVGRTNPGVVSKGVGTGGDNSFVDNLPKKYARGDAKIVKTDRGYETDAITSRGDNSYTRKSGQAGGVATPDNSYSAYRQKLAERRGATVKTNTGTAPAGTEGYYQRKSGTTTRQGNSGEKTNTPTYRPRQTGSSSGNSGGNKTEAGHEHKSGGNESGKSGGGTVAPSHERSGGESGGKTTRGGGGGGGKGKR